MDDALYDTTWIAHSIPKLTPSFSRLLSAPATTPQARDSHRDQLSSHAQFFQEYLFEGKKRYEREEERIHLGGFKKCTWIRLLNNHNNADRSSSEVGKKRKRETQEEHERFQNNGILITVVYEKKVFKSIVYTSSSSTTNASKRSRVASTARNNSSTQPTASTEGTAILLTKGPPSASKPLRTYLEETFSLPQIQPLTLSSPFIQSTLEKYLLSVHPHILGTVKLTLSFTAPVAPQLKSLELALPSETVQTFSSELLRSSSRRSRPKENVFMNQLSSFVLNKSGLTIPLIRNVFGVKEGEWKPIDEQPGAPVRVSRISTALFAIGVEGKVKFVGKGVDLEDGGEGDDTGGVNAVRRANWQALADMLEEVGRLEREEETAEDDNIDVLPLRAATAFATKI
ncbi:hypothetical protein H2200_010058 [Cladophialophora chaetospira]|uniref:Uncharacterized protein n=1 Tax=Cladophialophora chaetospira TaxID=386627 RepID=A0AA38X234_9EURO|nr:hypothetical protein H2200_010058 [Cladophialophora chaetospira]